MRLLYILAIILAVQSSYSQKAIIDSLKNELTEINDKAVRYKLLFQIGNEYLEYNGDSSFIYANKALNIAEQTGNLTNTHAVEILISQSLRVKGDLDLALEKLSETRPSLAMNDSINWAALNDEFGNVYRLRGQNDTALVYFNKAYRIRQDLKDTLNMHYTILQIGIIHLDFGQYTIALDKLLTALTYSQALGHKKLICDDNNNIARIYTFTKNYELAERYFLNAYNISVEIDNMTLQQKTINNLGFVLKERGKFSEAMEYFRKALTIMHLNRDVCMIMYPYYNMGNIHRQAKQYDSAEFYLNLAIDKSLECHDKYIEALAKIDLGLMFMELNELKNAEKFLNEALSIANSAKLAGETREALLALSQTYEIKGDYNNSLKFYKKYETLKDSLFDRETTRKLAFLEAQYEFDKQKRETELINKVKELENEQTLTDAIWTRNSFIIGFVVMIIIAFLIYVNFLRKRKANIELNQLYDEIQIQKVRLENQAEELKAANDEIVRINENLEDLIKKRTKIISLQNEKILDYVEYNSHQVRGPLARILGLTSLFEKRAIERKEIESALTEIHLAAKDMDKMVKKMNRKLEDEKKNMKTLRLLSQKDEQQN